MKMFLFLVYFSYRDDVIKKVSSLGDIDALTPLENFGHEGISTTPMFGSTISVRGVLEKRPRFSENLGTLLIQDEPRGAASSSTILKVDIQTVLPPRTVTTLLKTMTTGSQIGIKGRVEVLEETDLENTKLNTRGEPLRFKIVVDSDNHSVAYVEKKIASFSRQLSQPQWLQQLCSSATPSVGDRFEKVPETVFLETTDTGEIMKYVIAFRNSFHGNMLVGVKNIGENVGEITGLDLNEEEVMKWREKLSMAISKILPSSDEGAAICLTKEKALELVEEKSFVLVMRLSECDKKIVWIHVPKGEARLYVTKPSDVHAHVRQGAETKRMTDFIELFCRLDSLGSRRIMTTSDEELDIDLVYKEVTGQTSGLQKKYRVLEALSYENQEQEFKMIFGDDPVKTIQDKYLTEYSCGFLNSMGGSIIFGVQEDEGSKIGHIVGIVIPAVKRKELVETAVKTLTNFFPPVDTSQYSLVFHDVIVRSEYIVKCSDNKNMCVLIRGPAHEVGSKWPKFAKDNFPDCLCRVIRVQPQLFCIVVESSKGVPFYIEDVSQQFVKENKKHKISLDSIPENELKRLLKELCIIELKVKRSQYPIHITRPIDTHFLNKDGKLQPFDNQMMMQRFKLGFDPEFHFDVKKFLKHVDNFTYSGNAYVLIASPFKLSTTENDVYGLVIPKWALMIDFDQHLKEKGHLYQLFTEFSDLHEMERHRFIKTPLDSDLGLNLDRGICWLAARGYDELGNSLSNPDHASWNMTHRDNLRSLLKPDLKRNIQPNYLHIVVLWDDGHKEVVESLRAILDDILSMNSNNRTAVTIVCSTSETRQNITEDVIKPLQKSYGEIMMEERMHVAPPHVLARHLSSKLPDPYKPENEFHVPHKRVNRSGKPETFPRILPKHLRQNINGYLKMMYIGQTKKMHGSAKAEERKKFYSGSAITFSGLRENFGIERAKMEELENYFKILLGDRKSHVSMISVKVERGAGSTTMCLQFLFKHHEEYPCAQLIDIGGGLLSYIKDICRETKLPLVLFVDEKIAHLQDFYDFTKELVENRQVNVILIFIEPKESSSQKKATGNTRMKSASDHTIYGTCPYKEVSLRRELEEKEMDDLTSHLIDIDRQKEGKLKKLRERARHRETLRTFVHFGLTAFGENFSMLRDYVEFRLHIANEEQKAVLTYLSLVHVFTNSLLPANALADFLKKKQVNLDAEFSDPYLRELLSPRGNEKDSRRISFHEVAQEILKQLGYDGHEYNPGSNNWLFIKAKSVQMAKNVLTINASTKSIDRLTRRLFVTSEYEREKFSSLITAMTSDNQKRIARDTLTELVDVFTKHTSFSAHLLAHLAKYYMIVFEDFENARPRIEEAVTNQKEDSFLRHIHGDIIRLHVQALKNKPGKVDMSAIVKHAIKSSDCFAIVRRKRPHVSHAYISDAMVRITVMQAARKDMGGGRTTSFVDYLITMIDNMKTTSNCRLLVNERYLLSLIPDVHQFLNESVIDVDHKKTWKENFQECIGKPENLRRLCDKIQEEKKFFESDDSSLLHEVALQILILNNSLEIEKKPLNPIQIEKLIKEIYDPDSSRTMNEQQMKFWIRHCRLQKYVPNLEEVRKQVKKWVDNAKKKGGISPDAEFYK